MDHRWSGEAKYQALLTVAQVANSRRELSSVLEAVADGLEGLVPIDLIGVVTHEREAVRARGIYFRSTPRGSGERQDAYVRRFSEATGGTAGRWEHTPFLRDAMERDRRTRGGDGAASVGRAGAWCRRGLAWRRVTALCLCGARRRAARRRAGIACVRGRALGFGAAIAVPTR